VYWKRHTSKKSIPLYSTFCFVIFMLLFLIKLSIYNRWVYL
jgi:hypothetical protein